MNNLINELENIKFTQYLLLNDINKPEYNLTINSLIGQQNYF